MSDEVSHSQAIASFLKRKVLFSEQYVSLTGFYSSGEISDDIEAYICSCLIVVFLSIISERMIRQLRRHLYYIINAQQFTLILIQCGELKLVLVVIAFDYVRWRRKKKNYYSPPLLY